MLFVVTPRNPNTFAFEPDTVLLKWDDWNDYSYYTLFGVAYKDETSTVHDLSNVRIAFKGQQEQDRPLSRNDKFEIIGKDFFSLGGGTDYYESLNKLPSHARKKILIGLRDIAYSPQVLSDVENERVTRISLMRGIDLATIKGQYHRMARGGAKLSKFRFWFNSPKITSESPDMKLSYNVTPESNPSSNVHVLIGRNGVGKTNMINNMISTLYKEEESKGIVTFKGVGGQFGNVVSVSFSAFDTNIPYFDVVSPYTEIQFRYIGLKTLEKNNKDSIRIKTGTEIIEEFIGSFIACLKLKTESLEKRLQALESDPNFAEANIRQLLTWTKTEIKTKGPAFFKRLSSGHKIILLTITKLVETVQEKSLIFVDEPEAHLHPPLLSAFTRALAELLSDMNGVAIVATHSPVVLQEVPSDCVYKLHRVGGIATAERPEIETFGENVGILTREVFQLEVTDSGFYQLLKKAVEELESYDALLDHFNDKLGMEARALARVLFARKKSRQ